MWKLWQPISRHKQNIDRCGITAASVFLWEIEKIMSTYGKWERNLQKGHAGDNFLFYPQGKALKKSYTQSYAHYPQPDFRKYVEKIQVIPLFASPRQRAVFRHLWGLRKNACLLWIVFCQPNGNCEQTRFLILGKSPKKFFQRKEGFWK